MDGAVAVTMHGPVAELLLDRPAKHNAVTPAMAAAIAEAARAIDADDAARVVLLRGATDGWVPYGFLLPERGPGSLALHVVGLFAALLGAGAIVWAASRFRGVILRRGDDPTP